MGLLNSLRHKLQIARRLSVRDWGILIEAWWELLGARLALRQTSFERLAAQNAMQRPASLSIHSPEHFHELTYYASRLHLIPMTCLPQSLALRNLLAKRGIASQIKVGVKKTAQGIHAHAWVEVQGQAIGEENVTEQFSPLVPAER